jgi:low affinity Fe/Cu permease
VDDNNPKLSVADRFSRAAQWTSQQCGRAYSFVGAIVIIVAWAVSGPAFHYSDTWQLIINTGTTIITFLMVFLIQNTQNRDTTAIQLKLDELIRANEHAQNRMMKLEDLTENQIKHLKESFERRRIHSATVGGGSKGTFGSFRGYRRGQKSPPLIWRVARFCLYRSPAVSTGGL